MVLLSEAIIFMPVASEFFTVILINVLYEVLLRTIPSDEQFIIMLFEMLFCVFVPFIYRGFVPAMIWQ